MGRERKASGVQSLATVLQRAAAIWAYRAVAMVDLELLLSETKVFGLPWFCSSGIVGQSKLHGTSGLCSFG